MPQAPFFQLDAFTAEPFKGNPAAVCLMPCSLGDDLYLSIAGEMNLSETAFLEEQDMGYRLRWFTPKREVPLCGHATLAAAQLIFKRLGFGGDKVTFHTLAGELYAYRAGEGVTMDFPLNIPHPVKPITGILGGLGVSGCVDFQYSDTNQKIVVELRDEGEVRDVSPDFQALLRVENTLGWRGVNVTSPGTSHDFVSRYFAPWMGVNEDPVTGSAHTVLGPYWAAKLGKNRLTAFQASERGGEVLVEVKPERVNLTGRSVLVAEGILHY
jgi:predicted PhzF superfamily epimerase YddE/YHI9